jgi:trigger factor
MQQKGTKTVAEVREDGPFERIITVSVAGDVLVDAEKAAVRKLSKEVKVKGFRPGKAPRQVVESMVGAETLRREAVEEALPALVAEAIGETDLRPVVAPRITEMRDTDDGVDVDVRITMWPEVDEIPDYGSRQIEIDRPEVSDEDLEERIDRIRDQFAELEDVDREAFEGDYVLIDVSATRNGEEVEGASAKDLLYEVGSGAFLEGLDAPLRGAGAGTIDEFETTLPAGFGDEGGREVVARVLVKQVKKKRLPELTDEWVADISEFETVDEMRDQLRVDLVELQARLVRSQLHDKLLVELLDDFEVELPDALVDAEMDAVLHRFAHRLETDGVSLDQYFELTGQDRQAFVDDLRRQGDTNLRTRILLEAVARKEDIEVDDGDIDRTVEALAAAAQATPDEYRKALDEGGQEQTLTGDILRQKAMDRLIELAVPVDADGNEIELPGPDEGQDEETEEGSGEGTA